jgi:hypothetical protein
VPEPVVHQGAELAARDDQVEQGCGHPVRAAFDLRPAPDVRQDQLLAVRQLKGEQRQKGKKPAHERHGGEATNQLLGI